VQEAFSAGYFVEDQLNQKVKQLMRFWKYQNRNMHAAGGSNSTAKAPADLRAI